MASASGSSPSRPTAPAAHLAGGAFLLFSMWSLSFVSIEALLTSEAGPARFDWLSLTAARFVPAAALAAAILLLRYRREAATAIRRHPRRLILAGLAMVPGYNFALYSGQQHRVPAPVASLLTALAPLFVMLLSAAFLSERITRRRALGFVLALSGLVAIAFSRENGGAVAYPLRIALTALAPLSWSIYTVLTKPAVRETPPLVWTYLVIVAGSLPLLPVLPFAGGPGLLALDPAGWGWLLHLSVLCTIVGFALWSWLLSHLPATSVGFTIFLNPPMTTGWKLLLAALFPAAFTFSVVSGELAGGALLLAGVGVAILRPLPARP